MNRVLSVEPFPAHNNKDISKIIRYAKFILPIIGLVTVLGIVILGLAIATLVKVDTRTYTVNQVETQPVINTKALSSSLNSVLAASIHIEEVMSYSFVSDELCFLCSIKI